MTPLGAGVIDEVPGKTGPDDTSIYVASGSGVLAVPLHPARMTTVATTRATRLFLTLTRFLTPPG